MMRQLLLDGPARPRWHETAEPPLAGPYPFGHEGVAEVVQAGSDVTSVAAGDLVIVPFQISCGACPPCQRGRTGNCAAHPRLSSYGLGPMGGLQWGGLLADLVA